MIRFHFGIDNPWGTRFKNLGCLSGGIFKHKAWELEHYYHSGSFAEIEFSITTRQDHAGIRLVVGLLGYSIGATIYNTRHWNYETNKWEINNDMV